MADKGHNLNIPPTNLEPIQGVADEPEGKYIVPLDGQWIPGIDASLIGKNYSVLTNMRYADGHPEGVLGMTEINTSVMDATYFKTRSAFHFKKSQPTESHLLVQAYNSGLAVSHVLQNTTTIPEVGAFETDDLWTDSAGSSVGQFSDVPNGQVAYCNGVDSCIWGGDEIRCARFLNFDSAKTFLYDFTDQVSNEKTTEYATMTADNISVGGGGSGNDTDVALLLHLDNNVTDSSSAAHVVTNTGVTFTTDPKKLGTHSALFNAVDKLTLPADSDFDFSGGTWTIDGWFKCNTEFNTPAAIFYQSDGGAHYMKISMVGGYGSSFNTISIEIVSSSGNFSLSIPAGWWYDRFEHYEFAENGNNFYIFHNGTLVATNTSAVRPDADFANNTSIIGTDGVTYFDGYIDEFRISKVCRHTANFVVPVVPYETTIEIGGSGGVGNVYVGSLRPLRGIRPYIGTANTSVSSVVVHYWDGSAWTETTNLDDGTDVGGVSSAKTGTISFDSTVNLAHATFIESSYLYYYRLTFSGIDDTTTVYHVTLDAPFQPIVDLWDGVFRGIAGFYIYTSSRLDNTLNVREDYYDSTDDTTYATLSSLTSMTQYLEVGFTEQVTGILINVATDYENSTASTIAAVDYWNGEEYITVGTVSDGTSIGGISLSKSGAISWNNTDVDSEQKQSINEGYSLYYYRLKFNQNLDASVRVYYIGGITISEIISGYSFSLHAADRMMLGCDNYEEKNKLIISAQNRPDILNGTDYYEILLGDDKPLTCGTSIFAQYASNIFNMAVIFKESETWTLVWNQTATETTWERFKISPVVGCPAPRTLCTASVAFEHNINQTKVVAIWRAHNGIYITNGQAPLCVSNDIRNVFDQTKTTHASLSTLHQEVAFIDRDKMEYHWLFSTDLYAVPFTNGYTEPLPGETITGGTSGATGVIDHVVTVSGAWEVSSPSMSPSASPSVSPSVSPSIESFSQSPSNSPSLSPSASASPSVSPSISPSISPSRSPSVSPSGSPSISPSVSPSNSPSLSPSASVSPSSSPSTSPSGSPSGSPSISPSESPSEGESWSLSPSASPSSSPSASSSPSVSPSLSPSASVSPSASPSVSPSRSPSASHSVSPSASPSVSPSASPSTSFMEGVMYVRFVTGTWGVSESIKLNGVVIATTFGTTTLSSATNNALDQEYVLDLKKWKWFEIDRGTGKRLQCGVTVLDTPGNQYSYGFLDTGYMERLEDGTDFDGNDIICTLQTGDQLPVPQDLFSMTRIVRANLVTVAKNADSDVTLTHLLNGSETGTSYTMSSKDLAHRYANDMEDIYSLPGIFHSFKLSTTSDDETKGFEPIYLAVTYQKEREHTQ